MSGTQPLFIWFSVSFVRVCAQLLHAPLTPGDPTFCMPEIFHNRIILKAHWNSNPCYKMNRLICADQMLDGNLPAELILLGFEDAAFKRKTKTGGLGQLWVEQAVCPRCVFNSVCSLPVSGSHFGPAQNIWNFFIMILFVTVSVTLDVTTMSHWRLKDAEPFFSHRVFVVSEWMLVVAIWWHDTLDCLHAKLLPHARLFATLWTVARQAPLSVGFSRQEYWSGLPFPSPGHLLDSGNEPVSPVLQADSLPLIHQEGFIIYLTDHSLL